MPSKRYRAFISYSQTDKPAAKRLQRRLETYRVPKGVVVDIDRSRRLGRFFRDDEEMAASADLGAMLRGAIEDSDNLIVVCSPRAARSQWVNAEIEHFRSHGRGAKIFAVIVDGIPNSNDPATECLPQALKSTASTGVSMPVEPLGLNLRTESKRRVCAKLAAGLLNIPFDDLWRREQRRRRFRAIQLSAASVAIAGILGLLGYRLFDARRSARAQERATTLAAAIETLGTNAAAAISSVRELLQSDPADEVVNDVAGIIASWARTPAEIGAAFPMPRLFTAGNRLVLQTSAARVDIGDASPIRRIGFSGGRLVVIFSDRIVSVDEHSGQLRDVMETSATLDLPRFGWRGLAFEAADGTGIIAGGHGGISNSQFWEALLGVNSTGKLSLINKVDLPPDQVFVSPACDTIGVSHGSATGSDTASRLSKPLVIINDGLRSADLADDMSGGLLELFPSNDDGPPWWPVGIRERVEIRGCRNPAFDSWGSHFLTGLGGLLLSTDTSASPAAPAEWQTVNAATRSRSGPGDEEWNMRPIDATGIDPCARGCRIIDDAGRHEEYEPRSLSLGWVKTSLPPGGLSEGVVADDFAANPLYTFHAQHNAGVESAWCRRVRGDNLTCVTTGIGIEFQDDWSEIDLRSKSGRFMFYSLGFSPFAVFDVQAMRMATPTGNRVVSKPGAATFSSSADDRLFVFSDGRLSTFEPDPKTGKFIDVSAPLPWPRRLAGMDDSDPVVGVVSHPSDQLIAVSQNGLLIRFDWRTGALRWSRQLVGLGRVRAIRRSPAATYVALVGERGIRIVRTQDGLLASGVLVPPYLFDAGFDLSPCLANQPVNLVTSEIIRALTEITIDDSGVLTTSCGAVEFSWTRRAYAGDVLSRMEAMLAAPTSSR